MQEAKGLVFDVQSYSVHDGPGCRTVFFLMGCPLRCQWCANPEGWENRQRTMYRVSKCVCGKQGCSRCQGACPQEAITADTSQDTVTIDWNKCKNCTGMECVDACLQEALARCGKWYTLPDVLKVVNRDRQYWGREGGVTFSGGDPLTQHSFLTAVLKRCQEAYIHTTVETSGCFSEDIFMEVMKYVDFAFVDIKHMDENKHREQTGVGNQTILRNIGLLASKRWNGRLVIRIPIIPGYNDDDANITATAAYVNSLGLEEINILPFHRLGDSKWRQCGKVYPYSETEPVPEEKLRHIQQMIQRRGIICYVGHETPF